MSEVQGVLLALQELALALALVLVLVLALALALALALELELELELELGRERCCPHSGSSTWSQTVSALTLQGTSPSTCTKTCMTSPQTPSTWAACWFFHLIFFCWCWRDSNLSH